MIHFIPEGKKKKIKQTAPAILLDVSLLIESPVDRKKEKKKRKEKEKEKGRSATWKRAFRRGSRYVPVLRGIMLTVFPAENVFKR